MKNLEVKKLVKETEKALNLSVTYNDGEVVVWFPKSAVKLNENMVEVADWFWTKKEKELEERFVVLSGDIKDFEKSYGLSVEVENEYMDRNMTKMMFFPKSMVVLNEDNSITVPSWLYEEKEIELLSPLTRKYNNQFELIVNKKYRSN